MPVFNNIQSSLRKRRVKSIVCAVACGSGGASGDFWPLSGTGTFTNDVTIALAGFNLDFTGGAGASDITWDTGQYTIEASNTLTLYLTSTYRLQLTTSSAVFTDSNSPGSQNGLKYAADYSADFVARSLVDKGYTDGAYWKVASGGTATGANVNIFTTTNTLENRWSSLGTTIQNTAGLFLTNSTDAAAGAQQISPIIIQRGRGWKTNATAASQTVDFAQYVLPVQGAANPTGSWTLASSVNGAAYSTVMSIDNSGTLTLPGAVYTNTRIPYFGVGGVLTASANLVFNGTYIVMTPPNQANTTLDINPSGTASNGISYGVLIRGSQTGSSTSGGTIFSHNNVNTLTTGNTNQIFTSYRNGTTYSAAHTGLTARGIVHDPTFSGAQLASLTHYAWQHTAGAIVWGSVLTPAQITSNQNDYSPNGWSNGSAAPYWATHIRLSTDASRDITSLTGGVDGRVAIVTNVGAQNIVLKDDDGATGTAANRFQLNADTTVLPEQAVMLIYDGTSSRWRALKLG